MSGRLPTDKPSIVLIGLRGSGKTSVGRELATLVRKPFVDTDEMVVTEAGRSIAEIFAVEGESGFRRRERQAVSGVVSQIPAVISVGGGAVVEPQNITALRSVATMVWLTARVEVLWERIRRDPASSQARPALTNQSGLDEVQALCEERSVIYRDAADFTVDTTDKTVWEVAREIAGRCGITMPESNEPFPRK